MSSRVLRKLQGDNDLQQAEDVSDLDETDLPVSSSGNGGARRKQLNINRYDLVSCGLINIIIAANPRAPDV